MHTVTPAAAPGRRSSLPTHCRGLLADHTGRWLLVRHQRSPWWHTPGGVEEDAESPRQTAEREIHEELGLELPVVHPEPLLVAWMWPRPQKRRGRYTFVFDFGVHDAAALDGRIRLQQAELAEHGWFTPAQALRLLHPLQAERMLAVEQGRRYIEQHPHNDAAGPPRTVAPREGRDFPCPVT